MHEKQPRSVAQLEELRPAAGLGELADYCLRRRLAEQFVLRPGDGLVQIRCQCRGVLDIAHRLSLGRRRPPELNSTGSPRPHAAIGGHRAGLSSLRLH